MKAIDLNNGVEVLYDKTCSAPVHANGCQQHCPTTTMTPELWEHLKQRDRTAICYGCNQPINVIFGEPSNPFEQHYL